MFSKIQGLSQAQVRDRQTQYGENTLPEKPPPGNLYLLLSQLKSPLIYILILAGIVTLAIGHYTDTIIILLAVAVNTLLGFIQEKKATNALFALKHYVVSNVVVIRDGKRETIETSRIVPGDMVILNQGVKVPADGKLIHANRLYLDESVLTGESISIQKELDGLVFMGTTVASGQALMVVETIGAATKMGKIALQIQAEEQDTPLQKQLKAFSKQLIVVVGVLVTIVFVLGLLYKFSLKEMFTTSVALAVSSIPEGLIVSLTAVLAIGMQKILRRRGLVKQLAAAETLGGVSVICVDKTGTLTMGKMTVDEHVGDKKELAEQVLLANDLDDPIVIAAFEWGRTLISDFVSKHQRLDSIPFSPKERFFTSLHKWSGDENRMYVNGAPELLLSWSKLDEGHKQEIMDQINELTKQGRRLIGFARKSVPTTLMKLEPADAKHDLEWVGLLAFTDPVRVGVKEALGQSEKAGIRTIVITGDYAKTSQYVLSELGITISQNEILTGEELSKLTVSQLAEKIKTIRLFARTTPDQKLMIVEALKKSGAVVAMMGDGVNDAPALHAADIGVAVGEAADVAKESADLVLLDSNFATIVSAIEEGRVMFENIRKITLYLMSSAFSEILVIIGGLILGLPLPLTAIQILWINLVSDGIPNLSLTIDPKRDGIMLEPPRPTDEKLVTGWMLTLIGIVSLIAGLCALISFTIVHKLTGDTILAQSVTFLTLGLNSLTYVFSVRALMVPFWKNNLFENKWLIVAVVAGFGLQALPFSVPSLRSLFNISHLGINYWLIAIGLSIGMFFVIEVFKLVYQSHQKKLRPSGV